MTNKKNTLNSHHPHVPHEKKNSADQLNEVDIAVNSFVRLYQARAKFLTTAFIKKIKEGNRKALSELRQHPLPPTAMDLREGFAKCLKTNIPDGYVFSMRDGSSYTMHELIQLVPEWASIAEKALMESDPALADKLMSPAQWNAKCAFEVTFTNAVNEIRELRKAKNLTGTFDHYKKWVISPLHKAMEQVKAVDPPGNSLIGYGDRIPLAEAMAMAAKLENEFQQALTRKK